jgi:hypothetical protein
VVWGIVPLASLLSIHRPEFFFWLSRLLDTVSKNAH